MQRDDPRTLVRVRPREGARPAVPDRDPKPREIRKVDLGTPDHSELERSASSSGTSTAGTGRSGSRSRTPRLPPPRFRTTDLARRWRAFLAGKLQRGSIEALALSSS